MPMLTHNQIWTAIDRLAARAKLTPSGLAKKAGLDPTTFNKSKRVTPEGRPRWPSTESVAKALQATSTKFDIFVTLISDGGKATMHSVPLIGFAQAGAGGFFDDGGFPVGKGWEEIAFPSVNDEHAYALEISGDSMKPAYRSGDVIIVSPGATARKGDRVRGQDQRRRGYGQRAQTQNHKIGRTKVAECRTSRPHLAGGRYRLACAHRLGEPIGLSASAVTQIAPKHRRSYRWCFAGHRPPRTNRSAGLFPDPAKPDKAD